jgi:hypothetical protein
MAMVPNELNTTIDQFPLLWPLTMIFRIDGFEELLKQEGIQVLHHIVDFYHVTDS